MKPVIRWLGLGLVSAVMVLFPVQVAQADTVSALRCERTINKEFAKFIKTKSRILQKCKESSVKRSIPTSPVLCPLEDQDTKINTAAAKMKAKSAASCGGANDICNAADTGENADEPLAEIGWDVGACPDMRAEGCTNTIADCNDIGICLECIGHEAVNQATELYYDLLTPAEFGTRSDLNDCQVMIGKAAVKYLQTKSNLLQRCWDKVLNGKDGFSLPPGCPATDAKALVKLAQAEHKKIDKICAACGAGGDADGDNLCDLPGSAFSRAAIGFEPDCVSLTVPSNATSCAGPVTTLGDLIACVDCLTDFEVECTTDLAADVDRLSPECSAAP
jgi:hypothetical protein